MTNSPRRRTVLIGAAAAAVAGGVTSVQAQGTALPSMTDGPFYPPRRWRARDPAQADWDADLTRVQRGTQILTARGEHLALDCVVVDTQGRRIDGAEVEIWQCDAQAVYHHPDVRVAEDDWDKGFQGFGAGTSNRSGQLRFRTIRPVPYPGRTPHIHVKLRHASFGEWTSQLFIADDPGNANDFLWRRLSAAARERAAMQLRRADGGDRLRWQVQHDLVVPA
jgi:protocatechuate 3,4-dioxygenase, beta subunit